MRSAFTLAELLMVVAISAVVAAASVSMVRLPLQQAQRSNFLDRIQTFDALLRDRARLGSPALLVVSPADNQIVGEAGDQILVASPEGANQILEIASNQSGERRKLRIEFDRFGTSSSYAVRVGILGSQSTWVYCVGMTGEFLMNLNDAEISSLLKVESNSQPR